MNKPDPTHSSERRSETRPASERPASERPASERPASERHTSLAHLRHELRTPINAILGYSEMLLEDAGAGGEAALAELRAHLQRLHAAGEQLLAQVNGLLDPARIEAGQYDGDLQPFAAGLLQLHAPINTILDLDEMALKQAAGGHMAGMAPDLERIRQAGLSFLALIDLAVQRTEAGTTEETLSGEPDRAKGSADLLQEPGEAPASKLRGQLLVVDDNEENRDVLSRRVQRQGHNVAVAENGRQALERLAEQKFDLVLLDILMPEMNGYQVLQAMKSGPATRDIPVIIISALDEMDSVVRAIEMGAEDFLPKPFNPVFLKARIGACLEKKRLRDKEVEYLNQAAQVTAAAAAVEANAFTPESLDEVAARPDELGQLARVFQRMAREVYAREERLRQEVQALRIQVDDSKKERQVAEITETDYFQQLQAKAKRLRNRE